jgi:hypothetical protein
VAAAPDESEPNLAEAIRRRFAPLGGVDLEPPPEFCRRAAVIRSVIVLDTQCYLGADARRPGFSGAGLGGGAAGSTPRMSIRRKFSTALAPCPKDGGARRWPQRQPRCSPRILPAVSCPSRRGARPVIRSRNFDALIAATTLAAGASIATRDDGGFVGCGLTVIDPKSGS